MYITSFNVQRLSVRLLKPGPGTTTAEFLWLAPSRISNQQGPVEPLQHVFDLPLALLINILLVEGTNALGNGLPDGCTNR